MCSPVLDLHGLEAKRGHRHQPNSNYLPNQLINQSTYLTYFGHSTNQLNKPNMYKRTISIRTLLKSLQILRLLGPQLFLKKVGHQIFSQIPHLCIGKELDNRNLSSESPKRVILLPASSENVLKFFELMAKEGKESRYEMLVRKSFYEKGFKNCYIGKTIESDEMASITWLVTPGDVRETGFEHRYPFLKEDEILGENIYTLEKFRGKGVMDTTGRQKEAIAAKQGFKRILFIVREDNVPSLKSSINRGHLVYRRLMISHVLFRTKVKIVDNYNPPVPISIP
jgi:hypothetical protein